ncbi:hypothetical protein C9374_003375 [Naegleria lovaniensis]|uniref:Uncharacterized protein n=1 Tax=Naegleria lovaniensis TaxID=51637 RepID=A0AA88GRJ5_NAELO|nr:uncharacterized protein C9374_003375 [Naegleria lovaniensis]KAG2385560.1 hypothetical protein C9374_003375 [Naegleria lovaniensis]
MQNMSSSGNTPTAKRRLDSLMRHLFLSKPLQNSITMMSSMNNSNNNTDANLGSQRFSSSEHVRKADTTPKDQNNNNNVHGASQNSFNTDNNSSEIKTEEKLIKIDQKQIIQDLEGDKLKPDQALDLAHRLIDNSQFEEARQFIFNILAFIPSSLEENDVSRRAYRLVALSYYNNNELKEALPWFRKAALNSNSVQDWFNLANTSAQVQDDDSNLLRLAMYAFSQIENLHKESNFQLQPSFWIQLYYFIISLMNGKHHTEAFTLLNRLRLAYKRARFTDPSYLQEIGLPSFDSFIKLCLTLFRRVDRLNQGFDFLKQMDVDEAGKQTIERIISEAAD